MTYAPDSTDIKILHILQQNARMEISHIATKVHKSPNATQERIRKLKDKGYIRDYVAVLDRKLLGRPTLMVTLVKLNQHGAATLRDFATTMNNMPEVQVCLHLSGEFDFLLQVTLKDAQEYEAFLMDKLLAISVIEKVQSSLVLKECKMMTALPLV